MKENNEINSINNEVQPDAPQEAAKRKKKTFSQRQVILISVLCAVIVAAAILAIVGAVNDTNPISYAISVITKDSEKLIGNWQSDSAPGISAYVFNDDGSYDSYISSFNFAGEYEVNGNKLTLRNKFSGQKVVYKFSVSGNTLKLTLIEQNGEDVDDDETVQFNRVDNLNQKSIADLLGELKQDSADTTE